MTTEFQWVIDNAESLSIDRNPVVGQTITRNQTVRAVSRGAGIWKFTVAMPNGIKWTESRPYISALERIGKFGTSDIQLSKTGHSHLVGYQGGSANSTGFYATGTAGATSITITTAPTTTSPALRFKAGDVIQFTGSTTVYTVTTDVAYNGTTVNLNRPLDASFTTTNLKVGQNVVWTVICTQYPTFTINDYNLVQWSGPFVFYENRV